MHSLPSPRSAPESIGKSRTVPASSIAILRSIGIPVGLNAVTILLVAVRGARPRMRSMCRTRARTGHQFGQRPRGVAQEGTSMTYAAGVSGEVRSVLDDGTDGPMAVTRANLTTAWPRSVQASHVSIPHARVVRVARTMSSARDTSGDLAAVSERMCPDGLGERRLPRELNIGP